MRWATTCRRIATTSTAASTYHQLLLGFSIPDAAALAWATHDLGIWTAGTFDYLTPSADLAAAYADEFGIADVDQLRALVTEHHRLRPLAATASPRRSARPT